MIAAVTKRGGFRHLADRPIRTKLLVLLALPVAAILALSGVTAVTGWTAAARAEQARRLVAVGSAAGELTAQLQRERAAAALVFVAADAVRAVEAYRVQSGVTDAAVTGFAAARRGVAAPAGPAAPLRRVDDQLSALPLLREQVRGSKDVTGSVVVFRYRALIADLVAYRSALSQLGVTAEAANGLRSDATLSQAIEALGQMQVSVLPAIGAGQLTAAGQQQAVAADAAFNEAMETFRELAPARWPARLAARAGDQRVPAGERLHGVAARAAPDARLDLGTDADGWVAATGARMAAMHAVERGLDAELLASVTRERDEQRRNLLVLAGVVLACLGVLGAVGWWVTRSMTRPLRRLEAGATDLATTTLPALVTRLTGGEVDPRAAERVIAEAARPLRVGGRDEVGAVAAAFNQVAASAARSAGEQASLRALVSVIFEAVALRLQRQGDQVMATIDDIERGEEDPKRLEQLFELDQKATVVRRIIDNLKVFAGGRAGQPAQAPVPLPAVIKGAVSRVDGGYSRVQDTDVDPDTAIDADAAEELVHLLTELLDNATRYSARGSQVQISAHRVGDQLHVQISDPGIGIDADRLPELQARIDDFRMDADTARHMGLAVVGRIAARRAVSVTLRSRPGDGTRVDVVVPPQLFHVEQPVRRYAATMELPVVAAGGGPPPWPLPAVSTPSPPLRIFDRLATEHPWFGTTGPGGPPPSLPESWRAASAAAELAQTQAAARSARQAAGTGAKRRTAGGLPVRRPGEFTVPTVAMAPAVGAQRDPRAVARQFAAFGATVQAARSPVTRRQIGPP